MALIKCHECNKEISTDCKICPNCGAKKRDPNKYTWNILAAAIIVILYFAFSSGNKHKAIPTQNSFKINFEVCHEWKIPNGGFGRLIVVDPKINNVESLKLLGETLKDYTHIDRNAMIFIYDDKKAALMYKSLSNVSKSEYAFYEKHNIATYQKITDSNVHQLLILTKGTDGKFIEINY